MTASVAAARVDAGSDPTWAELVDAMPSDVFHSPAWARVLRDTYGFEVQAYLVVDGSGKAIAGMPLVELEDQRGRRTISLPFSDFCDPLIRQPSDWDLLAGAISTSTPVTVRCLRHEIDHPAWKETASFAWHRIDAGRPLDAMWDSLHSSARRAIRKAQSSGVEIIPASSPADLRAFFEMHLQVRKHKYGLLAQPYRFFEAIWEHFLSVGEGRLLLARADSRVVGGVLYLRWGDTLYYKFNASAPSELAVRPNDMLLWEGLRYAHDQGLAWLDFGVSDWDQEGLVRYKRKYATEEGVVRKYSAGPPLADGLGPLLGELTSLLVDPAVPDEITEKAGDLLYGLFG